MTPQWLEYCHDFHRNLCKAANTRLHPPCRPRQEGQMGYEGERPSRRHKSLGARVGVGMGVQGRGDSRRGGGEETTLGRKLGLVQSLPQGEIPKCSGQQRRLLSKARVWAWLLAWTLMLMRLETKISSYVSCWPQTDTRSQWAPVCMKTDPWHHLCVPGWTHGYRSPSRIRSVSSHSFSSG